MHGVEIEHKYPCLGLEGQRNRNVQTKALPSSLVRMEAEEVPLSKPGVTCTLACPISQNALVTTYL